MPFIYYCMCAINQSILTLKGTKPRTQITSKMLLKYKMISNEKRFVALNHCF